MIEIQTLEQFNEAVRSFKAENSGVLTNCFLMSDEINKLSSDKKLFIECYPQWLLILCDREDYSNLYYYTTDSSDVKYVNDFIEKLPGRSIFLDSVTKLGRGDSSTPGKFISEGIGSEYKSYQRMQLLLKNYDFSSKMPSLAEGYEITEEYRNHKELTALWKETLDEKSTPLPCEKEVIDMSEKGNLFSVLDSDKNLAAVVMLPVTAKQGLIQHLAVSPNHRRKGLARSLMNSAFICAEKMGLTVIRLWVDRKNSSAIALYNSLGFTEDGMICDQLYMKGK